MCLETTEYRSDAKIITKASRFTANFGGGVRTETRELSRGKTPHPQVPPARIPKANRERIKEKEQFQTGTQERLAPGGGSGLATDGRTDGRAGGWSGRGSPRLRLRDM